jgi:DNA repair protein RadC
LSKAELLAIILRTGTKECSTVELGEQILKLAGDTDEGLNGLHHVTLDELKTVKGIGQIKAIKIRCLTEFAVRMAKECAAQRLSFDSPRTVAEYYKEPLRHSEQETVLLLLLDNRLHLLNEHTLSIGTVKASLLSPREVFVKAVREKAVYVMLLHNHPGGDPAPSGSDTQITKQLEEAGLLLDIPLVDHIIIGGNQYYSYKESGLL